MNWTVSTVPPVSRQSTGNITMKLCRTGFAACLYTRQDCADHTAGCTTRTTCNSGTHPLHNFIVIFPESSAA